MIATYISDRTQGKIQVSALQVSHVEGPSETIKETFSAGHLGMGINSGSCKSHENLSSRQCDRERLQDGHQRKIQKNR